MGEYDIENHPDLKDPDWQKHAVKEAWVDYRRTRRRARLGRRLAITAVVLVVLGGTGFAVYRWGKATSEHYTGSAPTGGSVPADVTTTGPAPSVLPDFAAVDTSHPFADTPAQNWAEGIAGLTVPPATKVGGFSQEQVGAALEQVKQVIAAAQFDQATLVGHNPEKYLTALAPNARSQIRSQADQFVTYLADGYPLLPASPRMTGALTPRAGNKGELVVHTSYVVAYAFDPGSRDIQGPAEMEPFVRVDADYVVRPGGDKGDRGVWVDRSDRYFSNIACTPARQNRIAPAFGEQDFGGPSLSQDPGQYDPAKPAPTQGNCS
ncbi:hypothetical protein FHX82_002858 [Amycolatopsis bartoniae]|uniref:Uncharacterized protein n=1 Tax=Amycolatopsis bartoniae TaxID=941986 RepID=A0A8H9IWA8_9PSEU|nr:hypothetical protein [Amycolatopsis bartoniae]MBB2935804.1 hypothetical protein [Amycolatopsis bartoniae]TVT00277.1 hypothetical protein FNH07_32165 [Amycolatopsis bartoniae]GHF61967.1 hypothetical protein GCM10017566_39330 [Amycolatopsis bartoniae]